MPQLSFHMENIVCPAHATPLKFKGKCGLESMLTRKEYATHTKPTDCNALLPPIFQDFWNRQRYARLAPSGLENSDVNLKGSWGKNRGHMPTLRNIKHIQKTVLRLSASKRLYRTSQPRHLQNH